MGILANRGASFPQSKRLSGAKPNEADRQVGSPAGPSPWQITSPDGKWEVAIDVLGVDFIERTVKLSFNATSTSPAPTFCGLDFRLTQFDFPLTDYTQLDSEHRIALTLFDIGPENRAFLIKFIWFPPGYITERERPFDYRSIRQALKLD